jgi:outer membrane receptor protein involved in Fe transport
MKKIIFSLIMIFHLVTHAQEKISGKVNDAQGKKLDAVSITLSSQNKVLYSTLSTVGDFVIPQQPAGTYMLSFSLVGYKPLLQNITLPIDTLSIIMEIEANELKEITFTRSKPTIERKIDRVVFNVDNSIAASSGNVWDALVKAPGVAAGFDGSLTANQKGVLVYIDNKPVRLSGNELAAYLQGMPADAISKIEVMSNPPARYDAQGGAVINIITKKSKADGFNSSITSGYTRATYDSYRTSGLFNYRKDKLNIYGNYSYSDRDIWSSQENFVTYTNTSNSSLWNSKLTARQKSQSNNYRLGADYQINKNQIIGFLFTGNNYSDNRIGNTLTKINNNYGASPDSLIHTNTRNNNRTNQYAINLNYNIKLDSIGKSLNFDIDYIPFSSSSSPYLNNSTSLPDGTSHGAYKIYTPTNQDITIFSAKSDFTSKIGKTWSFDGGIKFSSIKTKSKSDFYDLNIDSFSTVAERSDNFYYKESNSAVYTTVAGTLEKFNLKAGLRGEYSNIEGYSVNLDKMNKKSYFKLFPTLYALYNINDNNDVGFSYSYRINRPEYSRLNPYKSFISPYSYITGNPGLRPSFIHSLELSYSLKKLYSATFYYTRISDMFTYITIQENKTQIIYYTQMNLGLSAASGLRLSATVRPFPFWEINLEADSSLQHEKSAYLDGNYDFRKFTISGNLDMNWVINKEQGFKAELNAYYNTPHIQGIFNINRNYDLGMALQKSIFAGRGTIKLSASDIFYGRTFRINVDYLNQQNGFIMRNEKGNYNLSLTYKLGKQIKQQRSRNTASEDEKRRTQ